MLIRVLAVCLFLVSVGFAAPMKMFQSVPENQAVILQKGEAKMFCPVCGMHLGKFYKTSYAATFGDGATKQYCSIHCLVEDGGIKASRIQVVDVNSLRFIDARKAYYVVGSRIKGTMSMKSKYAFATQKAAMAFANKNGGKLYNFDAAYRIAQSEYESDQHMVDKKRQSMAKMGQKIYKVLCDASKIPQSRSVADVKAAIQQSRACGKLKPKQLHAVGLYVALFKDAQSAAPMQTIEVPEEAKCPVCGMFVAKYPKWAAEAKAGDATYYFDGVKDMMKWYLDPRTYEIDPDMIGAMRVTDYYTLEAVDAKAAFYVIGSNVFGPMGNELIAFKNERSAETFSGEHRGRSILRFDEITAEVVEGLDR